MSITLSVAIIASAVAYFLPNLYKGTTTIIVDPGKVPESYVKSTATIDAKRRLAILRGQILSTTKLGQVIDELGLYKNLQQTKTLDEIVDQMKEHITVEPVTFDSSGSSVSSGASGVPGAQLKELQAFSVSFTSASAPLAAKVTNRLASMFIEENMKAREQQVLGTADFFDRELEKAREDVAQKSQKLAQLRSRYVTELPQSENLHAQALTSLQLEMRAEMDAISRSEQQKVYLQALLADSPNVVNLDDKGSIAGAPGLQEQLEHVQTDMDQLRVRYGPNYPDVLTKAAEIRSLEEQIKKSGKPNTQDGQGASDRHYNPVIQSQISQLADDIKKHETRENELKSRIAYYESELERAPGVEEQLTAATDEYTNATDQYKHLADHKFSADMSSDVEARQKGERFVIVEPAQPPERPYAPNRLLIDGVGFGGGLVLALILVVVIELLDGTVKTERELHARLKVPVFGNVPWLPATPAPRGSRIRNGIVASGNLILALGYFGLLAAAFR